MERQSRRSALSNGGAYVLMYGDARYHGNGMQARGGPALQIGELLSSESAVQQYPTNLDYPTKRSKAERAIAF